MSAPLTRDDFVRDTIRAHALIEERLSERVARLENVIKQWWEECPPESFATAQMVANLMGWTIHNDPPAVLGPEGGA